MTSTAQAEAEKRMSIPLDITGKPVKFDGNAASLSGVRYESDEHFKRVGAFQLLIQHNASRVGGNAMIATEDVNTIMFVTQQIVDPDQASYTYENPCPDSAARVRKYNAESVRTGRAIFNGIPDVTRVPPQLLKLAMPMPYEVGIDDHAYAL